MLAVEHNFYRQFQFKSANEKKLVGLTQEPLVEIYFYSQFF